MKGYMIYLNDEMPLEDVWKKLEEELQLKSQHLQYLTGLGCVTVFLEPEDIQKLQGHSLIQEIYEDGEVFTC